MVLKIWYLDDEPFLCTSFQEIFSSDQIAITTFSNHIDLLSALEKSTPDAFFTDYRLIGITGDEVAEKMDPAIPKYLITGEINAAIAHKFVEIILKPYDATQIIDILEKMKSKKD